MINWYNKPLDAYPNHKDYEKLKFIKCGRYNNMTKLEEIKVEHIDYKKVGSICSNCLSKNVVCKISLNEHCCKAFVKVNCIVLCDKCLKELRRKINND